MNYTPSSENVHKVRDVLTQSRRNYAELLAVTADLVQNHEGMLTQALATHSKLPQIPPQAWTISSMRRRYQNFPQARKHFQQLYGIKANTWNRLIDRVNAVETALVQLGLVIRPADSNCEET